MKFNFKKKNKEPENNEPPKQTIEKKKNIPYIKAAFMATAIGIAGSSISGYDKPWETTKDVFNGAMQPVGPLLEAGGLAIKVKQNERVAVEWGGSLDGLGYVAEPGYNIFLPFGHEIGERYRIDQQSMNIDKVKNKPISVATNDNQLLLNSVLTLQYKIIDDKVGDVHTHAQAYKLLLKDIALRVYKEVLGKINISNDDTVGAGNNLTAQRDEINRKMTEEMKSGLIETELEDRIEIMVYQLTDFDFTEKYKEGLDLFGKTKNEVEQAELTEKKKLAIANQLRIESKGQQNAMENLADGERYKLEQKGLGLGLSMKHQITELAKPGAQKYVDITIAKEWGKGGAKVPYVNSTGGNNSSSSPIPFLDVNKFIPAVKHQDADAPEKIPAPAPQP